MVFLDIHAIQTVPPANINRDESGSPKTAVYGGARRLRVSSQAWKRAARRAMERFSTEFQPSQRTKRLPDVLGTELLERDPSLGEDAEKVATATVKAIFNTPPSKRKRDGVVVTDYLLFLGTAQRAHLVDRLLDAKERVVNAADDTKKFEKIVKELRLRDVVAGGNPPAVALFGRMIATDPTLNVDAACQVAHAISTHAVDSQFDYYTAVDDVDQEADETGAGMIGTVEFNAATMYRYATVDLNSLVENLDGDQGFAVDAAVKFARAFLLSMPTGKRNTFANNTRPEFALLSVRDDQPVSLVGAFERSIAAENADGRADGHGLGHSAASVRRLLRHHSEQDACYGTAPVFHTAFYPETVGEALPSGLREATPSTPLPEALDEVHARLLPLVGAAHA